MTAESELRLKVEALTDHLNRAFAEVEELRAERDRARDVAVALEQENAELQRRIDAAVAIGASDGRDSWDRGWNAGLCAVRGVLGVTP